MNSTLIEKQYQIAKEKYAEYDINVEKVITTLEAIHLSIPCWQADDVIGLEFQDTISNGGGIMATGNYPGRPQNMTEIQMDLAKCLSLIPGKHRVNLHAMYGEFGGKKVDRNEIEASHFQSWLDWAKSLDIGLDFNSTYFAHPKADAGFTLSSKQEDIRRFWIEHGKRCREIAAAIGKSQGTPCIHNTWIPDGCKDLIIDKWAYRENLKKSLDEIYKKAYPGSLMKDSVESKLFGLGSETFVVGSYDFYIGYAIKNRKIICLDMGHFHPTESVADKLSAILQFSDEVLIHVTRSVRWDSDHVPLLNQDLKELMHDIVRNGLLDRVTIALDFFDASINRIAAYVLGVRATLQALLIALLEPITLLKKIENTDSNHVKLALVEHIKSLPFGAVWDYYCDKHGTMTATGWIDEVKQYENTVLKKRN